MVATFRQQMSAAMATHSQGKGPHDYADDPVGYTRNILKSDLTPDQETILCHLLKPPCIVNVPSANDTGKTYLAACAVNWWYDSFNPGACYTLAPRLEHLVTNLWAWVRILRRRSGLGGLKPSAPLMTDGPEHIAAGITAAKGESFKGRHIGRKLFVLEEAVGISAMYHDELPTMVDSGDAILYIYNPTSTTSRMYLEDNRGREEGWHRFPLSALNHPNIIAELDGKPRPFPGAMSVFMLQRMIKLACEPIAEDEKIATDFRFPPEPYPGGQWYRPGSWFQARGLGQWPESGSGVWSEVLFDACLAGEQPAFPLHHLPEIGVDCALGKGDDFHAIVARWGPVALWHEASNTMEPAAIFKRILRVTNLLAQMVNEERDKAFGPGRVPPLDPKRIPIKIDDDGVGGSLCSFLRDQGYNAIGIGAGCKASDENDWPRKRDELWFRAADAAKLRGVYLGALTADTLKLLREQLLAPEWDLDARGRRCVEPKEETKEKLGRSPDSADAFNLCWYQGGEYEPPEFIDQPAVVERPSQADQQGLFGRRVRG
jgi:hypothetical protein